MPASEPTLRQILFVDDDLTFLQTLGQLFEARSAGRWRIHLAQTTARALATLQEHSIDLIVVDVQMPVVDGEQFLKLINRNHPGLRKVVMSGFANAEQRANCLKSGAELFLEKPRSAEGFESVFATLDELASLHGQTGFRGMLRQVGLQDVIQMECLGRSSSLLEIASAHTRGLIYIKDGLIVHAEGGGRTGEAAFNYLLGLKGGDFSLKPFREPPEITIQGQWEFLLMEAARQHDEALGEEASAFAAAASGEGQEFPATADSDSAAVFNDGQLNSFAPRLPLLTRPPSRIDEFLVCSVQGDVLHQWQCNNINARIKLFDLIAHKSSQLAASLPIGPLERLEMQTPDSRLLIQLRADRRLLVVSSPWPEQIPG